MKCKDYTVKLVDRASIKDFVETYHYSKNINGCISDYCFALYDNDKVIGAMFYGRMAMRDQYKRFSNDETKVIELRRLCCIDDTLFNTESYFIGKTLKMLETIWRKDGIVVSYADKEHAHVGTIYKASNFKMIGEIPGAKVILWKGKQYHDKSIRTKYKGVLKPFALRLQAALDSNEAVYHKTLGKYTFIYYLDKKERGVL